MNVAEVISKLEQYPKDAPVYVYADHGQTLIQCGQVTQDNVEEHSYYAEYAWDEEGEKHDTTKPVIVTIGD